jgi:hypothetical protein
MPRVTSNEGPSALSDRRISTARGTAATSGSANAALFPRRSDVRGMLASALATATVLLRLATVLAGLAAVFVGLIFLLLHDSLITPG